MTCEVHAEFAEPTISVWPRAYEGKTYFNVLHIHGDKTYWDIMAKYRRSYQLVLTAGGSHHG